MVDGPRGKPTPERKLEMERATRTSLALYGPILEPLDPGPYRPAVPDYVWDPGVARYRWRRGTVKDGKNLSWHFHPVPNLPSEQKLYQERIRRGREDRLRRSGGVPKEKRPRA